MRLLAVRAIRARAVHRADRRYVLRPARMRADRGRRRTTVVSSPSPRRHR
jgi:hypothetical protein